MVFLLCSDIFKHSDFPQWGLQPRIASVCTGAGGGSGSTRFRRRFRRFRRRSRKLWCSQVTFNGVPEKVPGRFWRRFREASVRARSGSTGFRRRFGRRSGRLRCRATSGSDQQGSGKGSGEGLGGFGAEAGQVQHGFGEGSGEGLGGSGAEAGQVQQGSGEGSGEDSGRIWWSGQEGSGEDSAEGGRLAARSGSGGGLGGFAMPGSTGFRRRFRRRSGKLRCRAGSSSTGFAYLTHRNPAEVFPALGLAARFRKFCLKKKRCGC